MKCSHCGAENREGARFCRACGGTMDGQEPLSDLLGIAPEGVQAVDATLKSEEPEAQAEVEPLEEMSVGELPAEIDLAIVPDEISPEPEAASSPESPGLDEPEVGPSETLPFELSEAPATLPLAHGEADREPIGEEEGALPEIDEGVPSFWREEPQAMKVELPGELLAGRFVVLSVLDEHADTVLYHAHDLRRCWQCGFDGNAADDGYCARCGAAQDRRPQVQVREVRDLTAWEPPDGSVTARVDHGGRTFLVMAEPSVASGETFGPRLRLRVGHRSDVGQMRELNEDSQLVFLLAPTYQSQTVPLVGLFAVADGMGGHEGGEIASKLALQVLADQVLRAVILPLLKEDPRTEDEIALLLRQAITTANDQVYLTRHKRENDMGTTLTAALVLNTHLFLAHVGDCRAYRWNADGLTQLTLDHSVIASMVAEGRAAPEEVYTHPHRSVIYRCVGDRPAVEVDSDHLPLAVGERLVLCSDGLWEMVRSEGIADAMMQEADPQTACDLLVRRANLAGGEDNISVIVVQVDEA